MIFFLLKLHISISISLTSDNYEEILAKNMNKSLLIEFWNTWCNHCSAFKPVWKQLSSNSSFDIIFADIDCVKNKAFCKKFPVDGYPQILFQDTTRNEFIQYDGPMTIDGIESFIYKQINFPKHTAVL